MKQYTFDNFTINLDNKTIITGNQLWISLFNPAVSDTFRQMALEEINNYITNHQELTFDKSDNLVGILETYMTKSKPPEEKFNLLVFIYNENEGFNKDCLIKRPLLLREDYFKDFKQLVLHELEQLIF